MLFWRLGAILWLFRWIFRDPKVDVRFLFLGAVLPDAADLLLGTVLIPSLASGELWAHTLIVPTAYMAGVLLATRRGRRRRAYMALGVAWLFHLLLDGMWTEQDVIFWPFFGVDLPVGETPYWPNALERSFSDPWRWGLEVIGAGYLTWLWFAAGLNSAARRRKLLETGRVPGYAGENA